MSKGAAEYPQKTFRNAYSLILIFLSFAIIGLGNYVYTNHVQNVDNHQWCAVLLIASRPLPAKPQPTADQVRAHDLLVKLTRDKGCL